MRKRMMQLAKGRFDYVGPNLSFSVEKIEIEVLEEREYTGSFEITSTNHVPFRGVVYCNNPRMEVLTPQFEGEEARVKYQFHSQGLMEGDVQKGEFRIVCNLCEYSLCFCANISKLYAESSSGKISNLYEFATLAKNNWKEAYQLFYSPNFSSLIKSKEIKENLTFLGLSQGKPSNQNLEEFLIGIGKKERIRFSVDKTAFSFYEVVEDVKESFEIRKDQWGFLELAVSTDADFILLPKEYVETKDFLGNSCRLDFFISTELLHKGKNFGRIYIESVMQKFTIEIMATADSDVEEVMTSVRTQMKECKVGIAELYQAYRLKRIQTGAWASETIEILNHLHALEPEDDLYLLMKAQVMVINRQLEEAKWILEDYADRCKNNLSVNYGYFLYIQSLMNRSSQYVDQITREVETIFRENPDSVFLFWILSFLQEKYFHNNGLKLEDISYWVNHGCTSPYLYLEAYYLIWQEPFLLNKLDSFEIKIIRWAIRHHALTKDIANQIFEITNNSKAYDPVIFELMCAAFQVDEKTQYVSAICSYLIKGQCFEYKFHPWYEKGIEQDIRLTGLYEAYLLTLDPTDHAPIPKIIQMYFQYEIKLPFKKIALLYQRIIENKDVNPDIYQKYQRAMGRFAMEQAETGHMNDSLSLLYTDMLDVGLVNREIAKGLSHILFTYKLKIFDKRLVRALIYHRQLLQPQIVPVFNHEAYAEIYSNDFEIILEDKYGKRYAGGNQYQLQKLMNPDSYLEKCMELAPEELPYVLYRFDGKRNHLTFEEADVKYFKPLLFSDSLSLEFQGQIVPEIVRYLKDLKEEEIIEEYLLNGNYASFTSNSRKYFMNLLVEYRMYERAYEMTHQYGIDQLDAGNLVNLASVMVERMDGREDEFLTELALEAFRANKYDVLILNYLASFLQSTTVEMIKLWKACQEFHVECLELEEKILTQCLYSGQVLENFDLIFQSYYQNNGRELVIMAVLSFVAHEYFVKGMPMSAYVQVVLETRFRNGFEMNDACKLALFYFLSQLEEPSEEEIHMEEVLLAEYSRRNMYFAFYKNLDKHLVQKYHLYDKVFLEYRTSPKAHVILYYNGEEQGENFVTEEMPNVYDGIFVKQFAMFFGDVIQYYISEELDGKTQLTESTRITNTDLYGEKDGSRYNLINQMLISKTLQDEEALYQNMKQYQGYENVVQSLFQLL